MSNKNCANCDKKGCFECKFYSNWQPKQTKASVPDNVKYKYIQFQRGGKRSLCFANKDCSVLGSVEYNAKWKQWEFVPWGNVAFTHDCLLDIVDYIKKLEAKP